MPSELERYADWIARNVEGSGYGKCAEATTAMVEAFPELRRARGFYHDPLWGKRTHWWCVAPDSSVVDPTAAQFPSRGAFEYEELLEQELADSAPTGVCHDCGSPVFKGASFCSTKCSEATRRYLGVPPERWGYTGGQTKNEDDE